MSLNTFFEDLNKEISGTFTYTPMTGEEFQMSNIDDIIDWADAITGEWNGGEPGNQEDRAHCADEIIEKLNQVKELILQMGEL